MPEAEVSLDLRYKKGRIPYSWPSLEKKDFEAAICM
jgi:hypothetical protein